MTPGLSLSEPESPSQHIHPPLDDRVLIAIEVALRTAWTEILSDPSVSNIIQSGHEKRITNVLRERLDRIRVRQNDPLEYNCNVFERTHVDAEYLNSVVSQR